MSLTTRQTVIVVVTGIVLWFVAAMAIRFFGSWLFDFGLKHILFYVLLFPVSFPFVLLLEKIADLTKDTVFAGVAVATMAALFLDGIAIAFFPGFYSLSFEIQLAGAASILWGAAVFISLGWWRSRG